MRVVATRLSSKRAQRIGGVGAVALTALLLNVNPPATARASAHTFPTKIQHVVVIYQENHSFDNVLGNFCQTVSRPVPCNGFTGTVTLKDGAVVAMKQATDQIPLVAHAVSSQLRAIDGGRMDGWDQITGCASSTGYACLTYFKPSQIPNLTALAKKFAVSDSTFSMADSPSWGGHLYAVASTIDGFKGDNPVPASGVTAGPGWGCDSNKVTAWVDPSTGAVSQQPSCIPDPALGIANGGAFKATPAQYVPTIMDRLNTAGLSWNLYAALVTQGKSYNWNTCASFAECLDTTQVNNVVPTKNILIDAKNGNLPAFSLVLPGGGPSGGTSQHNGTSMLAGDNWIGKVVSAIETGPDWASTAIFIAYDDCGCFYDHVTPPTNPDGTKQGPRVPMVIVSPYARAGYTDKTNASFASILAYTEYVLNLTSLNSNDAGAYNFANAFNYNQVPIPGPMMVQTPLPPGAMTLDPAANADDPT